MNRSPWYRLADALAYGLVSWYAGSLPAPNSLTSVSPRRVGLCPHVRGRTLVSPTRERPRELLHASGMETVKLMHEALRKACMTRPSDAMWGKPYNGTATDWVTRGHLTPTHLSHQDQSNCVTSLRTGGEQEAGYGGFMYSRASVRSTTTSRALPRVEENTERLNSRDPWAIN